MSMSKEDADELQPGRVDTVGAPKMYPINA
jgi:hypothetical protein